MAEQKRSEGQNIRKVVSSEEINQTTTEEK
jgi:hypothetical protein